MFGRRHRRRQRRQGGASGRRHAVAEVDGAGRLSDDADAAACSVEREQINTSLNYLLLPGIDNFGLILNRISKSYSIMFSKVNVDGAV